MTSNRDIVETWLSKTGIRERSRMNRDCLFAIQHYFLMDVAYNVFNKSLKLKKARFIEKKIISNIHDGLYGFFRKFTLIFSEEQNDFLCEKLNAFDEHIEHHIQVARWAIMELVNDRPYEEQEEFASTWIINLMAAQAQSAFQKFYLQPKHSLIDGNKVIPYDDEPLQDHEMNTVLGWTKLYAEKFQDGCLVDPERRMKRLEASIRALTNSVCDWIGKDYRMETQRRAGHE